MVDALGPGGQSGLVGGRDTGSIKGDVVHPPFFSWNLANDETSPAGNGIIWFKGQLDFNILNRTVM